MVSFSKFIDPDLSASDMTHSSGYVDPSGTGSGAGGLSMEKRRQLLNQPRVVGSYQQSKLGRQYSTIKARTAEQRKGRVYDASNDTFKDSDRVGYGNNRNVNKVDPKGADAAGIERRQHFIEPSARPKPQGYNPYG